MPLKLDASYEGVLKTVCFIRELVAVRPTIGIVCGSGQGELANAIMNPQIIKYKDIPNFPVATVAGHAGNLVFGDIEGKQVVMMQGRFHYYEGYSNEAIAIPIRVMKFLGVEILILTNATGGLSSGLKLGDLVIVKDHISLPGLCLRNVLVGPNEDKLGPRFLATSDAYDANLRSIFKTITERKGYGGIVHEGVYVQVGGPTYESPAENRMLKLLGADVVGMSTVPEVIVARHAGMRVFVLSMVTNISLMDECYNYKASHEEVLQIADKMANTIQELLIDFIAEL